MAPAYPDVTLAVLAGGQARRLGGAPKGLLVVDGRTTLDRLLDLRPLFADVLLISSHPEPYARYGLQAVDDRVEGRGAPGGVHAALVTAATPWVLAVACDMPWVRREAVEVLLRARTGAQVICFEVGGRLQPFPGLYHTGLGPAWEARLAAEPSFRDLLARCEARRLPESALAAVDPTLRSVQGINTFDQAAQAGIPLARPSS